MLGGGVPLPGQRLKPVPSLRAGIYSCSEVLGGQSLAGGKRTVLGWNDWFTVVEAGTPVALPTPKTPVLRSLPGTQPSNEAL